MNWIMCKEVLFFKDNISLTYWPYFDILNLPLNINMYVPKNWNWIGIIYSFEKRLLTEIWLYYYLLMERITSGKL